MRSDAQKSPIGAITLGTLSLLQLWVVLAVLPPPGAPIDDDHRVFYLAVMCPASLVWLALNLWSLWRGSFRWYVEGAITSVFWLIYLGITASGFIYAR
jgi:hypothetical protein